MGGAAIHVCRRFALVAIGYKAKVLGSGVFVSGRTPESVLCEDLFLEQIWVVRSVNARVDFAARIVSASLFGMLQRKVIFRPGLGCTLLPHPRARPLEGYFDPKPLQNTNVRSDELWPRGEGVDCERLPATVDAARLEQEVAGAFCDTDPRTRRRTRAVVVVHDGRIIAERYAPGFSPHMPLTGWSMSKSVVNALVGILVRQGKLSLGDDRLLPEWGQPGDPRGAITLNQLLKMKSGLEFSENYWNPWNGVLPMLFRCGDVASYAAEKPLYVEPGSKWTYSSGTTNILCRILRDALASEDDYWTFPRRALFDRIGMSTAVLEPDASGTFVGSSFMYAGARDWARLGLLYLQDGVWDGERILPEGWVDYSRGWRQEPEGARYGAHFWLELPADSRGMEDSARSVPGDAFHAVGYEGQYLTIIPSMKLAVVRLGLTPKMEAWNHERFLESILRSIAER